MKKIIIYFILTAVICGCENVSKENAQSAINKDIPLLKQEFYINPLMDTLLKCKFGSEIYIQANSFCYEDSSSLIPEAEILLEIFEYVRLTDMVLNKLSTLSDNKIIETGGMLNITGNSNNKSIKLRENKSIKIYFPSKPNGFFSFYSEGGKNHESVNWTIEKNQSHPVAQVRQDTSLFEGDTLNWNKNNAKLNVLSFNKLGWINCDRFLNFDNTTDIFVKVEGNYIDSSTFCSVILKSYNSIIPGKIISDNSMRFFPLPINEAVTLFLISYKDGNYYMGIKDVIVKEKETYSVNLELVTKEQLKYKIEEFDKGRPL